MSCRHGDCFYLETCKDCRIQELEQSLQISRECVTLAQAQVSMLELTNKKLEQRIWKLENLVVILTSQTKFVRFVDENIALKQALLNCRMERNEPDMIKFIVYEILAQYPLSLEDLDKR